MIRQIASKQWRDELGTYIRFLARNGPADGLRSLGGAWSARRARRAPPSGLTIHEDSHASSDPCSPGAALPLTIADCSRLPFDRVRLATRQWPLSQGDPWHGRFEDPEDSLAAHRFGWIPQALAASSGSSVPGLTAMAKRWIEEHGAPGGPGWDSYSVAERTVHFAYLVSAEPGAAAVPAMVRTIAAHAAFLLSHLEFRGPATNNHLINDGRALYLASLVTGDGRMRAIARELLTFGAERMFVSGFLREGSSHYQLLLTRTFLEILAAARACGDHAFVEPLTEWSRDMVGASRFLAGGSVVPIVGDLSPDFPPAFLVPFATAQGSEGWGALLEAMVELKDAEASPRQRSHPEAGYFQTRSGGWVVFAWVNPHGHVAAWSHAHADLGSFVADWHGHPFLVDAGRATYSDSALGRYGRSVRSHNAIAIDGHEPCIVHGLNGIPELMSEAYLRARPRGAVADEGSATTLRISHSGFGRLGDGIEVIRTVTLAADRLAVRDEFLGSGRHRVETFFQCAPEVAIDQEGPTAWRCTLAGTPALRFGGPQPVSYARAGTGPDPIGWQARAYGEAVAASRFVFGYEGPLPVSREYVIARI